MCVQEGVWAVNALLTIVLLSRRCLLPKSMQTSSRQCATSTRLPVPMLPFVATAQWTTSSSECRHARLHDLGSHPAPASVIEGNRIYVPCIYVLNKIDSISVEELDLLYKIPNSVPISSKLWLNIDELVDKVRGRWWQTAACISLTRWQMWDELRLVRVYTKPSKAAPDYSQPVVLRQGRSSVMDFANAIHKEIARQLK